MTDKKEKNFKYVVVSVVAEFEHSSKCQKHIFNHNTDYIPNVSPYVSLPSKQTQILYTRTTNCLCQCCQPLYVSKFRMSAWKPAFSSSWVPGTATCYLILHLPIKSEIYLSTNPFSILQSHVGFKSQ